LNSTRQKAKLTVPAVAISTPGIAVFRNRQPAMFLLASCVLWTSAAGGFFRLSASLAF